MSSRYYGDEFYGIVLENYPVSNLENIEKYIKEYGPDDLKSILLDDNGKIKAKSIDELKDMCCSIDCSSYDESYILAKGIEKECGLRTGIFYDNSNYDCYCVGIPPVYPFSKIENFKSREEIDEIFEKHVKAFYQTELEVSPGYESAVVWG